jgi:hypothetical protein
VQKIENISSLFYCIYSIIAIKAYKMAGLNPNATPFIPFWSEDIEFWGDMVTAKPAPKPKAIAPEPAADDCSICMKAMKVEKNIAELECSHTFHKKCINEWLTIKRTCPCCRSHATVVDKEEKARILAQKKAQEEWLAEQERMEEEAEAREKEHVELHGASEMALLLQPIAEPDKAALAYPFSYIGMESDAATGGWGVYDNEYNVEKFTDGLIDEAQFDAGDFPNNIVEYYWIHKGKNDEDAWHLFCKIAAPDGEAYAYYTASCDYTGFCCQGGMKLIVSKSAQALFYGGLVDRTRKLCLKEKRAGVQEPIPEWCMPVPQPPAEETSGRNAVNPTRAFIRVWHNDVELKLSLDYVNGLEMEELEHAIGGLTAQFLTQKPTGPASYRPNKNFCKKKFYNVSVFSAQVTGIDDYFKKRFGNPDKRWLLRMRPRALNRKWEKVEVSFTLY